MALYGGTDVEAMYHLLSTQEKLKRGMQGDATVDLVDAILHRAIEVNASDIHFQPDNTLLRVRYRIDGVLYDQESLDHAVMLQVLSRIKILSSLDIAEKRIPQDGKFKALVARELVNNTVDLQSGGMIGPHDVQEQIDFRVSTFPSIYGEKMVVRILNRSYNILDLELLGMSDQAREQMNYIAHMPYGFFLVTGPTGAGKTTTLYAMLSLLNRREKNIITMEDPVEYDLPGITQSQVNRKAGFTFENGLRSILRQDPDVIMIGEIRDRISAQIAIESALTGHLVLSTLHTNDAPGALTRLIDMGIEPFLVNATLTGVLAQRLVRKLCNHCKKEVLLTDDEQKRVQQYGMHLKKVYRAAGCRACVHLGYKGRLGLFELLVLNDSIRHLIIQKASTEVIRHQAMADGMHALAQDGMHKVAQGLISLEEFISAIG